jgi:hypothetical protein
MLVIQKSVDAHETEVRVGINEPEVLKTIDQARARLRNADRNLGALRNKLSYK